MTWLHLLNLCVLQWLFVRLARRVDNDGQQTGWTLLYWVWPTTGYGKPYRYIGCSRRS